MSALRLSAVIALMIDGQWCRVRPGSARLVPSLVLDDCTPGAEQICTLPGIKQDLMTDNVGINSTGVDNPQQLTWVHENQARRFFCNPAMVQAWQVEDSEPFSPIAMPASAVSFDADHSHLMSSK